MRVLIVSHNVLSPSSAMGRTLLSYFSDFSSGELAQLYIHSEVPIDGSVCTRYFRFTDTDALYARLPGLRSGTAFGPEDIRSDLVSARTDAGSLGNIYQYGRRRSPVIYLARNLLWKTAFWKTKALKRWLREFDPEIVFFASGDYAFTYDIADWIAREYAIPLVNVCLDDFYCNNINKGRFLGGAVYAAFMRTVRRTMRRTDLLLTICDAMGDRYGQMFGVPVCTLYTGAYRRDPPTENGRQLSYIGNLGHLRHKELISLGRALKALSVPDAPDHIDVYSAEARPEILQTMTEENGIRFHGMVSADEAAEVMANSMAVVHVESFDPKEAARVRYSVSTKIADSLMNGPCLIAFGPRGIASVDYLAAHNAAWVITEPAELPALLRRFFDEPAARDKIVRNARTLAEANHRGDKVSENVRAMLQKVIEA